MPLSARITRDRRSTLRAEIPLKLLLLSLLLSLLLLLSSCGKKGPPTLASYEKLPAPGPISAYHREGAITISWAFPKDEEDMTDGFIVLRASDGTFERLAFLQSDKRSYADSDFRTGEHYRYKVVSRNLRGILSDDSNVLAVTPLHPPPPPNEISFAIKGTSVILSWQNEGKDIRYNVYKNINNGSQTPSLVNDSPLSVNSFTDAFEMDRIVCYSLRSVVQSDVVNEGPPSAEVEVDPFALVPPQPEGLKAFPAPDRVILYWEASPESWVMGFNVYRKIGDGPYALIGHTQIPTFVDITQPSTKRDYMVRAVGPRKEGPAAEVKNIIFLPQD
jgi:fibronectin type 3 domain-containing protein